MRQSDQTARLRCTPTIPMRVSNFTLAVALVGAAWLISLALPEPPPQRHAEPGLVPATQALSLLPGHVQVPHEA